MQCLAVYAGEFPTFLWPCNPSAFRQLSMYHKKFLWQKGLAKQRKSTEFLIAIYIFMNFEGNDLWKYYFTDIRKNIKK